MVVVRIDGPIFPEGVVQNLGRMWAIERDNIFRQDHTYTVTANPLGMIVECELPEYNADMSGYIVNRSKFYGQSILNLACFSTARLLTFVPVLITLPDGTSGVINQPLPHLVGICTAFSNGTPSFGPAFMSVVSDPNVAIALDDIVRGTESPIRASVNYARAMDGIRKILTPKAALDVQWSEMRRRLNLGEPYLRVISEASTEPRHGQHIVERVAFMDGVNRGNDLDTRAWTIMNRFLALRLRGIDQLPLDEFPHLN